ncbi:MAG: hypothetical protein M1820_010419, partial [Bogoriella megaspora]
MKSEHLENQVSTLLELYWYLQSKPSLDANRALAVIRSGMDPSKVMEALESGKIPFSSHESRLPAEDANFAQAGHSSHQSARPSFQNGESSKLLTQPHSAQISAKQGTTSAVILSNSHKFEAMLKSPDALTALESGVEAFHSCTGCIFHVFDKSEAESLFSTVAQAIREAGEDWPSVIFGDSTVIRIRASLCAVSIMAAIGLQYTRDPINSMNFEPSKRTGTYAYVNVFYELSKHSMEAAIEYSPVDAMKICAAISMFNIIGHATIAVAYTEMGLKFALNL